MTEKIEPLAQPIKDFCQEIGFSVRTFYNLKARGEAPRVTWIGSKQYVMRDTGRAWLKEREAVFSGDRGNADR